MIKLSLVVLVGGKGTRLKKVSKGIPKPIVKINNKTFLDNILNRLYFAMIFIFFIRCCANYSLLVLAVFLMFANSLIV